MSVKEITDVVTRFFAEELQKPGQVIAIVSETEGWRVQIEVAEEVEYMRRRARNDLMAIYEVHVRPNMEIASFERKFLRERNSTQFAETQVD